MHTKTWIQFFNNRNHSIKKESAKVESKETKRNDSNKLLKEVHNSIDCCCLPVSISFAECRMSNVDCLSIAFNWFIIEWTVNRPKSPNQPSLSSQISIIYYLYFRKLIYLLLFFFTFHSFGWCFMFLHFHWQHKIDMVLNLVEINPFNK